MRGVRTIHKINWCKLMKHSIFIRSYDRDLPWLRYCLRSIKKNWDMTDGEVVVCFPNSDFDRCKCIGTEFPFIRLTHWSDAHPNGYIDQQINKLNADIFCQGEFIVYVDSDCFLRKPANFYQFFEDGRPYWMHTDYSKVGDATCWKECTSIAVGHPVDREYMRRIPLVVRRDHLPLVREYVSEINGDFMQYMARLDRISEFNLMGAVLHEIKPNYYKWIDTDERVVPTDWTQGWSHGGITSEKREELEGLLK